MNKRKILIIIFILIFLFSLSLFIKGIIPQKFVFLEDRIDYLETDAYYNVRLIENTLRNYPNRMFFDPFTKYPYGEKEQFAPFFDYSLSTLIWIAGFSNPFSLLKQSGIESIIAWYPAIIGSLLIIPIFYISKNNWNDKIGIISALILSIIPGEFLKRSTLGFVDHHIMEVMLLSIFIYFFIKLITTTNKIKQMINKKNLLYIILSGISLGFYFLNWIGAPLITLFIISFTFFAVIIFYNEKNPKKLLFSICIMTTIALFMIIPFFFTPFSSYILTQLLSLFITIFISLIMLLLFCISKRKNLDLKKFLIILFTVFILISISLKLVSSQLFDIIFNTLINFFVHPLSSLTISEVQPSTLGTFIDNYSILFITFIIGFLIIIYEFIKKKDQLKLLIIIWTIVILLSAICQRRFHYYLALNVSILSALFFYHFTYYTYYIFKRVRKKNNNSKYTRKIILPLVNFLIIISFILLPLNYSYTTQNNIGLNPNDWFEALYWIKNNTPNVGIDYYHIYSKNEYHNIAKNLSILKNKNIYGILTWWDYGHWILQVSKRIPLTNPFQQNIELAANLLIETNNSKIYSNISKYNINYIITDFPMVDYFPMVDCSQIYYAIPLWANKNPDPIKTLIVRLHFFDGSEISNKSILPLENFRLVYESSTFIFPYNVIEKTNRNITYWFSYIDKYDSMIKNYSTVFSAWNSTYYQLDSSQFDFISKPISYVKIFEFVKGREIEGFVNPNSTVKLTINITTNQNRKFQYIQYNETKDGHYNFIVPYNDGWNGDVYADPYIIDIIQ